MTNETEPIPQEDKIPLAPGQPPQIPHQEGRTDNTESARETLSTLLKQRLGELWQAYQVNPNENKQNLSVAMRFIEDFRLDVSVSWQGKLGIETYNIFKLGYADNTLQEVAQMLVQSLASEPDEGKQFFANAAAQLILLKRGAPFEAKKPDEKPLKPESHPEEGLEQAA